MSQSGSAPTIRAAYTSSSRRRCFAGTCMCSAATTSALLATVWPATSTESVIVTWEPRSAAPVSAVTSIALDGYLGAYARPGNREAHSAPTCGRSRCGGSGAGRGSCCLMPIPKPCLWHRSVRLSSRKHFRWEAAWDGLGVRDESLSICRNASTR